MEFSNDIHLIPPKVERMEPEKDVFFSKRISLFVEGLFSGSMWNFRGCTSMLEPNQCGLVVDDGVILYHLGMCQNHRSLAQSPTFYQAPVGVSDITRHYKSLKKYEIFIYRH